MTPDALPARIADRLIVDPSGCWIWQGRRLRGYGQVEVNEDGHSKTRYVHRVTYQTLIGEIPDGLELDHLCRVRPCANPAHLEPVTRRENLIRGDTFAARNSAVTHCPQGHPYSGDNLYIRPDNGQRGCKACKRIADQKYKRNRRMAPR